MGHGAIALVAHSHPAFSKGGGEMLAYRAFQDFKARDIPAILLATIPPPHLDGSLLSEDQDSLQIGPDEYLLRASRADSVLLVEPSARLAREITRIAKRHGAGILHFHHMMHIGLETIDMVRRALPEARVGLTLHEFLPLCLQDGQMLKRGTGRLCLRSGPAECHGCFPELPSDVFRFRAELNRAVLSRLHFRTAPSRFLAARFEEHWPDLRVDFVENGAHLDPSRGRPPPDVDTLVSRFAFFGQPTPYKGVDVFLRAAFLVLARGSTNAEFHIHGMTEEQCFHTLGFSELAARVDRWRGRIVFHGPYSHDDLPGLLSAMGWVVVPSIWWENSPLVIQEAFAARRPVIASGIGGMAEKVRHGIDGLHVRVGDEEDLADAIESCLADPAVWLRFVSRIAPPRSMSAMNDEFLAIYDGIGPEWHEMASIFP